MEDPGMQLEADSKCSTSSCMSIQDNDIAHSSGVFNRAFDKNGEEEEEAEEGEEERNEKKEDVPEMEASRRNDSEASLNGTKKTRKVTKEALFSSREQKRAECVRKCRAVAERLTKDSGAVTSMNNLLEDKEFSTALFCLFDQDGTGFLDQIEWFEMLRINTGGHRFGHISDEKRLDIVEMIENATFIVCDESPVNPEEFRKVVNSRGIRKNLFKLADANSDGELSVEEVIDFLVVLSKPRHTDDFTPEQIQRLEDIFKQHLPPNKRHLTLAEFKGIMPSKNAFFVERVFKIFDIDGNGRISLAEFLDNMYQYAGYQSHSEKVLFLFKVYDIDGDGVLQEEELEQIMRECLRENGMELAESDIQALSFALYEEAIGDGQDTGELSIDQLKDVFSKHEGLLENLTISLTKWMVPQKPRPKKTLSQKIRKWFHKRFSMSHARNQWQLFSFLLFIVGINIILFATRAAYFGGFANLDESKPNPFYLLSRANGRCLLFNSTMILVVVLRYTVSKMRDLGLSKILPLDHNVYIHKFIGVIIFVQAWWHSIMHFINFAVNVQPDPVKFVQINNDYWPSIHYSAEELEKDVQHPNWHNLGYHLPPGCDLILDGIGCPTESLNPAINVTACQICPNGEPWSLNEIIFTSKPGVFGLIGGIANPSGIALIVILTIMVICSMSVVRRSGYFQVFYYSHLLYYSYMILLILHAPDFWKWVIAPLVIFLVEKLYRGLSTFVGHGKSYITNAQVMASRVTALQIKRPDGFKYSPGDWMFVRIPKIATYEWHPFTISSAPENREYVTLHIRGCGQWTNRLYDYVEAQKKKEAYDSRLSSTRSKVSFKNVKKQGNDDSGEKMAKTVRYADAKDRFDLVVNTGGTKKRSMLLPKEQLLEIHLDGPFGAPASNIFRAEHAVLVATGIGVTPFSSILQSIMYRYRSSKRECPRCQLRWLTDLGQAMQCLRKVDFFWINRDQKSFEWFLNLLTQMEAEQQEEFLSEQDKTTVSDRFLDIHLYFTAALQRTDIRAVGMHLAMDLLHDKYRGKDVMTGLKARTNAGRPNWDKIFQKLQDENKGKVTVFYCGNQFLAKTLRAKCEEYGFNFRKEVF